MYGLAGEQDGTSEAGWAKRRSGLNWESVNRVGQDNASSQ